MRCTPGAPLIYNCALQAARYVDGSANVFLPSIHGHRNQFTFVNPKGNAYYRGVVT